METRRKQSRVKKKLSLPQASQPSDSNSGYQQPLTFGNWLKKQNVDEALLDVPAKRDPFLNCYFQEYEQLFSFDSQPTTEEGLQELITDLSGNIFFRVSALILGFSRA